MKKTLLDFSETGYFSKLIQDYITGEEKLKQFFQYPSKIESFKQAIEDKQGETINRKLLVEALHEQNIEAVKTYPKVKEHIDSLGADKTFTVTTGHQLCLFTGPLYFIYKIISTINLADELKKKYPGYSFVPVYWMASEDHDLEEINHVNIFGKKLVRDLAGDKNIPAGKVNTASLASLIDELKVILGESENAKSIIQIFRDSYLNNDDLGEATRHLGYELFGKHGLVIINADDIRFKKQFIDIIKDDVLNNSNYKLVNDTIEELQKLDVKQQVNPRKINFFYIKDNSRNRIEEAEGKYKVLDTSITFTKEELLKEIEENPARFSPNVVTRPLYQQRLLPNIAYVGGPGELSYWLEYKAMFDHHKMYLPVLMLRNSILWIDKSASERLQKLNISAKDLFRSTEELIKFYVQKNTSATLDLQPEELRVVALFKEISGKAGSIDLTLKAFVEAELQKSLASLKNIEAKMLKAEKQKQETSLGQIKKIKEKLFPSGNLQERQDNFIPFYLQFGENFISILKKEMDPFEEKFIVLEDQ